MRFNQLKERVAFGIAWWLPRWLVYLCAVRLGVHATSHAYGVQIAPTLLFVDALERWEKT